MERPPVFRLTDAEKDALIVEQAALIERLAARVSELESLVGKAKKTSSNSHQPPSSDGPGRKSRRDGGKRHRKSRPSWPGSSRLLSDEPDRTEQQMVDACPHCGEKVGEAEQHRRHHYDHIDLPVIRPVVTRVELFGGRCRCCGKRYRAERAGRETAGNAIWPRYPLAAGLSASRPPCRFRTAVAHAGLFNADQIALYAMM